MNFDSLRIKELNTLFFGNKKPSTREGFISFCDIFMIFRNINLILKKLLDQRKNYYYHYQS